MDYLLFFQITEADNDDDSTNVTSYGVNGQFSDDDTTEKGIVIEEFGNKEILHIDENENGYNVIFTFR